MSAAFGSIRCASNSAPLAATAAADRLMRAWSTRQWISRIEDFPAAPADVAQMYAVHLAMQNHPLAGSLGGLGGYKIGAVGAEGEACLYAPLFRDFLVEAKGRAGALPLSAEAIQMHQVEPEFSVVMGEDVPPRTDGQPHAPSDVWARIDHVALSIECCGQRCTPDVAAALAAATSKLGKFQDALLCGGCVLGKRLHGCDGDALASCETSLSVNGEVVSRGSGAACPEGGPVGALSWLANHLNARGLMLRKGQLVATGQTCIHRGIVAGDTVVASFGNHGEIEMVIAP